MMKRLKSKQPQHVAVVQEPKMIKLELSVDEVNGVLMGLSKLPYEFSAPLIEKLKQQADPQVNPVVQAPVAE
jgi:16S rRNA A1518/A1519 N6-dimethyltransferase RsmA/KsgA/DIM1 with predicted DNA glycosylase/AP lyase activity